MDALDVLAPIKDSIMAKEYAKEIAFMLKLEEDDVVEKLSRLKAPRRYDEDDGSAPGTSAAASMPRQGDASTPAGAPSVRSAPMSVAERNRLKSERSFLGLVAQHPLEALGFADALSGARWHADVHLRIAGALSSTLMNKLDATPIELIEAAANEAGDAAAMLTEASVPEEATPEQALRFFAEELKIGDIEDELAELRRETRRVSGMDEGEAFRRAVQLQEQLNDMKNSHKPLE